MSQVAQSASRRSRPVDRVCAIVKIATTRSAGTRAQAGLVLVLLGEPLAIEAERIRLAVLGFKFG
jgi:hypothetical protein